MRHHSTPLTIPLIGIRNDTKRCFLFAVLELFLNSLQCQKFEYCYKRSNLVSVHDQEVSRAVSSQSHILVRLLQQVQQPSTRLAFHSCGHRRLNIRQGLGAPVCMHSSVVIVSYTTTSSTRQWSSSYTA